MRLSLPLTSRRDFLKTAATASLLPLPAFVPSTALAAPDRTGANGKIRVGLIGAGNRAKWLSRCMARESARAELVAVCDCYLPQVDTLAADYEQSTHAKPRWAAYQNYEEMYDTEDLDGVMIATPDHAQAVITEVKSAQWRIRKKVRFCIDSTLVSAIAISVAISISITSSISVFDLKIVEYITDIFNLPALILGINHFIRLIPHLA